MEQVLVVGLAVTALCVAALTGAASLALRALRRRNRVSPAVASPAPLRWLWSPGHAARTHRRLAAATDCARAAARARADWGALDDLARSLEQWAVELDGHVVVASRASGASRRRMVRELRVEVGDAERAAERIARMARTRPAGPVAGARPIHERLDALDAALGEL